MAQTISNQNLIALQALFNRNERALFREKAARYALSPADEAALLLHVCLKSPAPVKKLAVLFESLLCSQTIAATTARHSELHHVNAAFNAANAVDAILARKNLKPAQLPQELLGYAHWAASRNNYRDAARAVATLLPQPT